MKHSAQLLLLSNAAPDLTPASIAVVSGSGQSANCGAAYAAPLVATVKNAGGTGLAGVAVTFTAPTGKGTFAVGGTNAQTVSTDTNGVATSSAYTAGAIGQEGAYNVVASVGTLTCNFALTNLVLYILRDEFTTTAGAPLTSPRTCEPGPGTLTLVQTDGQFSISSGKLNIPVQASPAWGDQGLYGGTLARQSGRALFMAINFSTLANNGNILGFGAGTGLNFSNFEDGAFDFYASAGHFAYWDNAANIVLNLAIATAQSYTVAVILNTTGSKLFVLSGGTWYLVWYSTTSNDATVRPKFANQANVGTSDFFRVRDLPTPFNADTGIATQAVASPVSGTSYAGVADGIFDLTVTAPTPLANTAELRFRQQDATNYWTMYFAANGSFNVDSVVNGTPTNRITVAAAIAQGNTRTMRVMTAGTLLDAYTLNGSTWTKQGTQVDQNLLVTQTTVVPVMGTGWTCANLRVYARTNAAWDTELNKT